VAVSTHWVHTCAKFLKASFFGLFRMETAQRIDALRKWPFQRTESILLHALSSCFHCFFSSPDRYAPSLAPSFLLLSYPFASYVVFIPSSKFLYRIKHDYFCGCSHLLSLTFNVQLLLSLLLIHIHNLIYIVCL